MSADGGATWRHSCPTEYSVYDVAAGSDGRLYAVGGDGLYATTDGGVSWAEIWNSAGQPDIVHHVLVTVGPDDALYHAVNSYGVYRINDAGVSWSHLLLAQSQWKFTALFVDMQGRVLAAVQTDGVYRSDPTGENWQHLGVAPGVQVWSLAQHPDGALFAGTYRRGLYRSQDDGTTWQHVGLGDETINALLLYDDVILAAGEALWYSLDSGTSWIRSDPDVGSVWLRALALTDGGAILAGTEPYGIYRGVPAR